MTLETDNNKLRSVKIDGTIKSVSALYDLAVQFGNVAHDCDSAAHELSAITMYWAAGRIQELEGRLDRIRRESL